MYRISNKDRADLLVLLDYLKDSKPATLKEQNRLRKVRAVLRKLQRSKPM
mgnify:CR=1 FL=1